MGYESTLIFGLYRPLDDDQRESEFTQKYGNYFQTVMTIDLSKMGYELPFAKLLEESSPNDELLSVYYRDGDESEQVDPYGDTFKVLDPDKLVQVLGVEVDDGYRRAILALPVVEAWRDNLHRFDNPPHERAVILHYGH